MSMIIDPTTSLSLTVVATGGIDQRALHADSRFSGSPGVVSQSQVSQRLNANAVAQINDALTQNGWKMEFVVDKSIGRLIMRIVDTRTNEVLAQEPAESMLATARALAGGTRAGALIDRQA